MNLLLHINHGTSAAQSHRQRRIDERVRVLAVLTYNNLFNSRVRGQYRCCLSNGPAGRVHHAQPRPLMPACDAIMGCDSNVNAVNMVGHGREETNYFMLRCLLTCHANHTRTHCERNYIRNCSQSVRHSQHRQTLKHKNWHTVTLPRRIDDEVVNARASHPWFPTGSFSTRNILIDTSVSDVNTTSSTLTS